MRNFIEITHLHKRYSQEACFALEDISWRIAKGEFWALIGASGAGKTTLLRLLAGLSEPDAGAIWLGGAPLLPPSQKLVAGHPKVQVVPQDFQLLPNHRVYENIEFVLRHLPTPALQQRLHEILELCALTDLAQRYPRALSGGQQQRVALARALAPKPWVLLLDEPFSQLDYHSRAQFTEILQRSIAAERQTTILITHETRDALALAHKIAVLEQGKLVQTATPQDIWQQPASRYVAELFGRVNWLPASWVKSKAATRYHWGIRPEALRIVAADSPDATHQAVVLQRLLYGNYWRVLLSVAGGLPLWADVPSCEAALISEGKCGLCLPPQPTWYRCAK